MFRNLDDYLREVAQFEALPDAGLDDSVDAAPDRIDALESPNTPLLPLTDAILQSGDRERLSALAKRRECWRRPEAA